MFILITIWFIFFNTLPTNNKISTEEISIKTSKDKTVKENKISVTTPVAPKTTTISNSNLDDEIKLLLKKAENLIQESKDEEALKILDTIIEKIANSNDPKLLKHFASACMSKGYIYQLYPNIDNDAAIEAFSIVINRFEKSNNSELIQLYIDAKIQLSYLLPYDEKVESYNELLSKYENNTDINIQKKLESLLITKSFQLMGQNDEEAMEILDKVIEKYQERNASTNLPENVRFSILNNIELALITNNEGDSYVELAKKFMSNSPDTKPLLDMLDILKNSQEINQDEALEKWKEEHGDYHFPDWSFQEVERWAYQIEDKETKDRVSKYINAFTDQKYNTPNKYSNTVIYEDIPNNKHNATQIYDDPYAPNSTPKAHSNQNSNIYTSTEENSEEIIEDNIIEEEIFEEEIYQNDIPKEDTNYSNPYDIYSDPYENSDAMPYEPDPYVQEIYEATGEYPNSYE
jgi:hypothetical protein